MKKFLKTLLALTLALLCVTSLFACAAKPETDLKDAADNLEDADYMVTHVDDEDDLEPFLEERLSASDGDENSLTILVFKDASTAKLYYQALKNDRDSSMKDRKLEIKFYETVLKKYEDDMDNDDVDDYEDEIKDMEEELEERAEKRVIGRSGKIVWYGTADAIEDSKG